MFARPASVGAVDHGIWNEQPVRARIAAVESHQDVVRAGVIQHLRDMPPS